MVLSAGTCCSGFFATVLNIEKYMATFFVSRHPGAIDWAKKQGLTVDIFSDHLDPETVNAGDSVIGNLPMAMAADICGKGARYFSLSICINRENRGKELISSNMDEMNCKIEEFKVMKVL